MPMMFELLIACSLFGEHAPTASSSPESAQSVLPGGMAIGRRAPGVIVSPQRVAFGQAVNVKGVRVRGAKAEVWFEPVTDVKYPEKIRPAYQVAGVKVGEAVIQEDETFTFTFTINERMGPTANGTFIDVQPGREHLIHVNYGGTVLVSPVFVE